MRPTAWSPTLGRRPRISATPTAPRRSGWWWWSPAWTWTGSARPRPGGRSRRAGGRPGFGLPETGLVVTFVGRLQPLKAPDVLLRAAAELRYLDPQLADSLTVVIAGGHSGTGLEHPTALSDLAGALGISAQVRFLPPRPAAILPDLYRASDLVAVPSHNESFGLVALEAQACGTPVVAAAVGGLVTVVRDGDSGVLVPGHDPAEWARVSRSCSPPRPGGRSWRAERSPTPAPSPGTGRPRGCWRSTGKRWPSAAPGWRQSSPPTERSSAPERCASITKRCVAAPNVLRGGCGSATKQPV